MSPDEAPVFAEGQIVTVFRSRRRPGTEDVYGPLADAMLAAARTQPGFVDFATFESADGERVSLVTFDSPDSHALWRDDPRHRSAQRQGRDELYDSFTIQVGVCTGVTRWVRPDD
ncbi:MAG: antibiotic biosynthesis monooxygenase [Acidimicrobiales bacterium]|jgi:heme-degrading monooxygenase HmoA